MLYCMHQLFLFPLFWNLFNQTLYRSIRSLYFSIETHFVVTEYAYAYCIFDKGLVFILAYTVWPK